MKPKLDYELLFNEKHEPALKVALHDYELLYNPLLNKGTAFSQKERDDFGLNGLLPLNITNLSIQKARSYEAFLSKQSDIEKYIYLRDLQDSNETLFYSLLLEHFTEMLPIVYTPVVGLGCQRYSHIYRRPRGLFIAYPNLRQIKNILQNPRFDRVKVIVVSDGERILGLGDQGAGGMGIPIGKLALYTACAGIHPAETLPILLDTGTNNKELQQDPLYIGWPHERIRGEEYAHFIDAFVSAVKIRFPHILLQWEDFSQQNASSILQRFQPDLCTFNDDIQGTATVALATLMAAIYVTEIPWQQQRIVILGAGSAGCGIATLMMQALCERGGLSAKEAKRRFYLVDRTGLLLEDTPSLLNFQKPFVQSKACIHNWILESSHQINLFDVIKNVKPTLLIGTSSTPNAFTENIIREMTKHVPHPIILPLSNPNHLSEATPLNLLKWSEGKAFIGTGSPFPPLLKNGKIFNVDQTNNCYIFPGLGLGLLAVQATQVTQSMLLAAAYALADLSPAKKNKDLNLLPPLQDIRKVSLAVATAVAKEAIDSGYAEFHVHADLKSYIESLMWHPYYLPYVK